jgi:hypothetical protein
MKTERTIAADHEQVTDGVIVAGETYVERATAALQALGGKARQLGQEGAPELRRMAKLSGDALAGRLDKIEQLAEYTLVRLRALVDASR